MLPDCIIIEDHCQLLWSTEKSMYISVSNELYVALQWPSKGQSSDDSFAPKIASRQNYLPFNCFGRQSRQTEESQMKIPELNKKTQEANGSKFLKKILHFYHLWATFEFLPIYLLYLFWGIPYFTWRNDCLKKAMPLFKSIWCFFFFYLFHSVNTTIQFWVFGLELSYHHFFF